MLRLLGAVIGAVSAILVTQTASGHAQSATELHRLFEERSGRCVAHARDLVHKTLTLMDGVLQSRRSSRDIRAFQASTG